MAQQTRHGLYGGPRGVYAGFVDKPVAVLTPSDTSPVHVAQLRRLHRAGLRKMHEAPIRRLTRDGT